MPRPKAGDRLLFVGDSITECSRRVVAPPLGGGFVQLVAAFFQARHPELAVEFLNRGVDGDTVEDLARRWDDDVLAERPDWVFVMIGVNDELYGHLPEHRGRAVPLERYEHVYRSLLRRTREALAARIVILDPTPLEADPDSPWHAPMRERAAVAARLAREFDAGHLQTFDLLLDAFRRAPDRPWMLDVPHPNLAGHAVLAGAVLDFLEGAG